MARHIAFDPGALGVAQALGDILEAPVVASNFSRLVIDPNRGEDDPTLLMRLYDGTVIPANQHADQAEIDRRLTAYYHPYHSALEQLASRQDDTVIVSVHSFTPQLRGRPARPWDIGVLFADDARLSRAVIAGLKAQSDLTIGVNEPYSGHLPGDAIDRHALQQGRHNTLLELRNDLISTPSDQRAWANRLAPILSQALKTVSSGDPAYGP